MGGMRSSIAYTARMAWLLGILGLVLLIYSVRRRLSRAAVPQPPLAAEAETPPVWLLTDELDLHAVAPQEVDGVVDEFIRDARSRGLRCVKIVHGKGIGVLRRRVRARLARHPEVAGWDDATTPGSGRGATIVQLRAPDAPLAPPAPPDLV